MTTRTLWYCSVFFFNDTATTEIYTLSLHDALPIFCYSDNRVIPNLDSEIGITVYSTEFNGIGGKIRIEPEDFQVTELISQRAQNSINDQEGYAVYKLKKKKIDTTHALSDVFRKKGIRLKALGLKDASAITEQFVCSGNKGKPIENFSTKIGRASCRERV